MTEAEWLASCDPLPMLNAFAAPVGGRVFELGGPPPASEYPWGAAAGRPLPCLCCRVACERAAGMCPACRKLLLFGFACCRRALRFVEPASALRALEAGERHADGLVEEAESMDAALEYDSERRSRFPTEHPPNAAWNAFYCATHRYWRSIFDGMAHDRWRMAGRVAQDAAELAGEAEPGVQAALLRDVLGNPFRRDTAGAALIAPAVSSLALAAYEERGLPSGELDPARLAVLSDALEEAGCADADLLSHLRAPGPHVRGCWALDLVLGKE